VKFDPTAEFDCCGPLGLLEDGSGPPVGKKNKNKPDCNDAKGIVISSNKKS
jgi:hypothetical protein